MPPTVSLLLVESSLSRMRVVIEEEEEKMNEFDTNHLNE